MEPLIKGEIRSCVGMVEPDRPGSNPAWLKTQAVLDNDDYVINGRKWFTSSADGATFCVLMVVTNPDAENKYQRASMMIVPLDTPGVELIRNIPIMGERVQGFLVMLKYSIQMFELNEKILFKMKEMDFA